MRGTQVLAQYIARSLLGCWAHGEFLEIFALREHCPCGLEIIREVNAFLCDGYDGEHNIHDIEACLDVAKYKKRQFMNELGSVRL